MPSRGPSTSLVNNRDPATSANPGGPARPTSGTAAPRPPTAGLGVPISASGGVVRVQSTGQTAQVLRVDPAPGYTIKDYDPGPASEIQIVLLSTSDESEIKVSCGDGEPIPRIKETPQ